MKPFLLLLVALCFLAPNVVAQDEKKAPELYLHELDNGLQIQAYDTDTMADETTDMLGIRFWKVLFSTKQKGKQLMTNLELRTPGKEAKRLGGGVGVFPLDKANVIFAVQSIDGDDFTSSPKTRFYVRLGEHTGVGSENRSPGNSYTIPNPFLGLGNYVIRDTPTVRADGSIVLVTFQPSDKNNDPKNSELVVVATLQDPPPAK